MRDLPGPTAAALMAIGEAGPELPRTELAAEPFPRSRMASGQHRAMPDESRLDHWLKLLSAITGVGTVVGCLRFSSAVRAAQPPPIGIVMTTRSASTGRLRTGSLEWTPSSSTTAI